MEEPHEEKQERERKVVRRMDGTHTMGRAQLNTTLNQHERRRKHMYTLEK